MKTYYENMQKEKNTSIRFPRFINRNRLQQLVASMQGDQADAEWKLHTIEDMQWNHNHQHPIKYWGRDILNVMDGRSRTQPIL